ncbi:response regulator [Basilea psittacipulmonis]|uniref:XRE family transcriptional regulator n=1 Tax=Basilea psittacipulmonis DSM 24701 TaxID=1072685 RepID=A0A077DD41_9BURK|nr:response regulator [Basilea psittacipulmonis]AIL32091.1 XRE family transcriptional regulator [Basilea psittacipulmonis DSM 24701]
MARILVVDDEIGIRELLSEILYDEGHTVELAENATQARLARQQFSPDLVLLDIWMPDTDGVSLLKEWSAQGLLTMPVIMMSGHGTIDTAVEAVRIGATAFLEKPIALQKLLKTVKEALSSGMVLRANQIPSAAAIKEVSPVTSITEGVMGKNAFLGDTIEQTTTSEVANAPLIESDVSTLSDDVLVSSVGSINLGQELRLARDQFERLYFDYHLAKENFSMTRVSKSTGLERTNLYRKLRQLGIDTKRSRKD